MEPTGQPSDHGTDERGRSAPNDSPRTYVDRVRAKIRTFEIEDPADTAEVVEFRRRMYGSTAFKSGADYLAWMYGTEPTPGGGRNTLWVFRSAGVIEGHQGGMRVDLLVDGTRVDAIWAIDLVVSPSYQLRGVGPVLTGEVTSSGTLTLGIEVSDAAHKAFTRAGWADLGEMALYARPLGIVAAVGDRAPRAARWPLRALDVAGRVFDAASARLRAGRGFRLERVDRFDERADRIWSACGREFRVIVRRDATTLNWRYVDVPPAGFYQPAYVYRGDRLLGYVVLRHGVQQGHRAGVIVDFLCAPSDAHAVFAACVDHFRSTDAEVVYCLHPGGVLHRRFQRAGFMRRSMGWRFMALVDRLDVRSQQTVCDPANWHLTYGDGNVDHPRDGEVYADAQV